MAFTMIAQLFMRGSDRLCEKEWSERRDSNPRPLDPQSSALPGCATLRFHKKPYDNRALKARRNLQKCDISTLIGFIFMSFLVIWVYNYRE